VKTSASSKQSTGVHRIHLSGNRTVVIDTKDLSDRSYKDVIGICVTNSQAPETLLVNLKRIPGVLSANFG
jgi:hypothetical protein